MEIQETGAPEIEPNRFEEITYDKVAMNPNNPPWNSLIAVFGVWVPSVLLILFVPLAFLIPYLLTRGVNLADNVGLADFAKNDPSAILVQIGSILPAHLLTLLVGWLVITNFRRFPFFETLGWKSGGMRWWHYLAILAVFFGIALIVGTVFPDQENEMLRILKSSRFAVFVVAFLAVFTAPLVEEVVYRGVLYSAFQRTVGTTGAVIIVTALFAIVHVPQYYPSVSTIILLTLLSLILTMVRVRTNNLLPCIILHTIFNAFQSLLLVAEPYFKYLKPAAEQQEVVINALF